MTGKENSETNQHPKVRHHPEQERQEQTGQEDASNAGEVGQSGAKDTNVVRGDDKAQSVRRSA